MNEKENIEPIQGKFVVKCSKPVDVVVRQAYVQSSFLECLKIKEDHPKPNEFEIDSQVDKAVKSLRNLDGGSNRLTEGLSACFRTRISTQNSRYVQSESSQTMRSSRMAEDLKQLWRVLCFVQMKDKLLAGFMTCWLCFGKSEDPLKLEGVHRPASHVRSTTSDDIVQD
ncbi:hypothetical protein BDZ45DRAFT_742173 [Acephala macrosclerotiorum]|nr:hypothetical protein BDZ45DRAFT_742173 [Acephala macrosclerotiorum]